ncbi:MAG: hypothetical protein AAB390_02055 [Patescibacteria group bacterium]
MAKLPEDSQKKDRADGITDVVSRCLVCVKKFGNQKFRIIEKRESERLLHIVCPHCRHAMLVSVGISGGGVLVIGSVTDLSLNDVRFLLARGRITEDELLAGSALINNNSRELIKFLINS